MSTEEPVIIVKKKGKGHGGHHGGAWKVAYADFVTAMMAFFLVMWLVNQSDEVRAGVGGYFREPGIFEYEASTGIIPGGSVAAGEGLLATATAIRTGLEQFARIRDQVAIQVTDDGLQIELIETSRISFFGTGSAILSREGEQTLRVIAEELGALGQGVVLEGHSDARRFLSGEAYTNWELSADRANAARRFMVRNGMAASQILEVRGYADTRPRIPEDPMDPRNRRVSIFVSEREPQPVEPDAAEG